MSYINTKYETIKTKVKNYKETLRNSRSSKFNWFCSLSKFFVNILDKLDSIWWNIFNYGRLLSWSSFGGVWNTPTNCKKITNFNSLIDFKKCADNCLKTLNICENGIMGMFQLTSEKVAIYTAHCTVVEIKDHNSVSIVTFVFYPHRKKVYEVMFECKKLFICPRTQ